MRLISVLNLFLLFRLSYRWSAEPDLQLYWILTIHFQYVIMLQTFDLTSQTVPSISDDMNIAYILTSVLQHEVVIVNSLRSEFFVS